MNYHEAIAFCRWKGEGVRLLSEAEWNRALQWSTTEAQNTTYIYAILPDIPVGRLPAENIAEAKNLVDKTLSYYNAVPGQSSPFGDWRLKLNIVTGKQIGRAHV